jgi:hypothetical protein
VYVSQSTTGIGDGSSCSNAHSATWFNTSSSWGAGAGQIAPGDVVHLCGTISSDLTAHGSGLAGSPITIYFEPGAKLSQPACASVCLMLDGQSYITIDGGGTGVIENTANGTGLGSSVADSGINADPCTGCTIEYLTIQNMYVRTSDSDTSAGASSTECMNISGSNVTVADNTMDYAHWCVYVDENHRLDSNVRFYGNDIHDTDHGIALAFYNNTGGAGLGPFYFYDNYVHDYAAWDSPGANYHHDGFHCYHSQSSGSDVPYIGGGLYLYNNVFGGDLGADNTAQLYLEGEPNGPGTGTICSSANSPVYIFNNVVQASAHPPNNQYFTLASGTDYIYNNTILGNSKDQCLIFGNASGGSATVKNNLISCGNQEITNSAAYNGPMTPDYNLYAAGGSNAFSCNGTTYAFSQFSRWQSCIRGDSHSSTAANALINSDGSLQSGSPAAGKGANLTGLCNGALAPLCSNIYGVPRPGVGPWNAGAF